MSDFGRLRRYRHFLIPYTHSCEPRYGTSWQVEASACNTDTTPTQPHRNSNTHRIKNNTTNVTNQQNRRKLLMMDILMSETCWAHKKWNKMASDIKLVFYSSTIIMMHGPINIKFFVHLCMRQHDCYPSVTGGSKPSLNIRTTTKCSSHISRPYGLS